MYEYDPGGGDIEKFTPGIFLCDWEAPSVLRRPLQEFGFVLHQLYVLEHLGTTSRSASSFFHQIPHPIPPCSTILLLPSPHPPPNPSLAPPLPPSPQRLTAVRARTVLLVGNPTLPLKGFPTAIAALSAVARVLPLHVRWVCQQRPMDAHVPSLSASDLDIEYVVAPAQEDLPRLYRGHDVFVFASRCGGRVCAVCVLGGGIGWGLQLRTCAWVGRGVICRVSQGGIVFSPM